MSRLDDPFAIVASILVLVMSAAMFVVLVKMNSAMKMMDDENYDREKMRRQMKHMLMTTGAWQISIGLFLAAMGSWTNMIPLVGIGVLVIVAAHYNVFTGMRQL